MKLLLLAVLALGTFLMFAGLCSAIAEPAARGPMFLWGAGEVAAGAAICEARIVLYRVLCI